LFGIKFKKIKTKYRYINIIKKIFIIMIENGTVVNVHYTGKLTDGSIFDSSEDRGTLRFEMGTGQIIPGFESALMNKKVGDKVTVNIKPEEAYGPVLEELIVNVQLDRLPENIEIGQMLEASLENGQSTNVTIVNITEEYATIDGNHPLAGQDLIFDIEVVSLD
jgi:peptidylprolyl isomerase